MTGPYEKDDVRFILSTLARGLLAVAAVIGGLILAAWLAEALYAWWYVTTHCTVVLGTRVCQ